VRFAENAYLLQDGAWFFSAVECAEYMKAELEAPTRPPTARDLRAALFAVGNQDAPLDDAVLLGLGLEVSLYRNPTARELRNTLFMVREQDAPLASWYLASLTR